ncbi:hypothetical protein [Solitalea canadensis]|uniref:Uncharacterized protein n=1 Tax=Solitalea canadensis (strain ATCC 29591 / DSM 3403 / JCM 21819 / LMG 8368 / NBRC 15130 / NCIMB 12057 / USAM 9D) TaxID=929556 RepID=H8KVS7_SOLCM|nr:hypothetical protein [Solitalea canadensis]AFD06700.1 hypothetical protein Solca_1633 [Solitalea canadensis DSM 3403]
MEGYWSDYYFSYITYEGLTGKKEVVPNGIASRFVEGKASDSTPDARVFSINVSYALGGGYSFELGLIVDRQGNSKWFTSHGPTIGLGSGIGGNMKEVRALKGHTFNINKDYEGYSSGYSGGVGVGYEYSGNRTNPSYENSDWNLGGENYTQRGYSYGYGADFGLMWSRTFTSFFR